MNASTSMRDNQQQTARIVVKDAAGRTDDVTTAAWESSDPTICAVQPGAGTQRSCKLVAGNPGQCTVTATCGAVKLAIAVAITASADTEIDASFDAAEDVAAPSAPADSTVTAPVG